MLFREENNEKRKIALDDHVSLLWEEIKINTNDEAYKPIFNLLNFAKRNPIVENDKKVFIDGISDINTIIAIQLAFDINKGHEENISTALKYISKYFSLADNGNNIVAVYLDMPEFNNGDYNIEEEYYTLPPSITNRDYLISNYGNVIDESGKAVKPIYYDDGPRIPIYKDSGGDAVCLSFYSLAHLMMDTFDPILDAGENVKMTNAAADFTNLLNYYYNANYKDISAYCNFAEGKMLIYTDSIIGKHLVDVAKYIDSCV